MQEIVRIKFGSHLYGTNTPASDLDFKSVYIPDGKQVLLQKVKEVVSTNTKKDNLQKNSNTDIDIEQISLQKYLNLVLEGQTVALDILFAPSWAHVGSTSWIWNEIVANKSRLITKKYMSFVGYCRTQANKYGIKGSRMAAAKAASEGLAKFGAQMGTVRLSDWRSDIEALCKSHPEFIKIVTQLDRSTGKDAEYFEVCDRKTPMNASIKTAWHCYSNLYNEYGARARAAETNEGIDWKALSPADRIGEQAVELLQPGNVIFLRENAADLLAIKLGNYGYGVVASRIETLLEQIESEASRSGLRDTPDVEWVEQFIERHHYEAASQYYRRKAALSN